MCDVHSMHSEKSRRNTRRRGDRARVIVRSELACTVRVALSFGIYTRCRRVAAWISALTGSNGKMQRGGTWALHRWSST